MYSTICIPASPATWRHRQALRQDGFTWIGGGKFKWWERRYDANTYYKWKKILRREPDAGEWPVRAEGTEY